MTVETEIDTPGGWEFGVRIAQTGRPDRALTLRMSWADSDHWSCGVSAPSIVARAVVELALERKADAANLGDFDAAMLRRWFPGADETLRNRLSGAA